MRRSLFLMSVAGAVAGCSRSTRPRLNVLNWSSYVAPDTIPNFEREFNVRVRYSVYESNEEMLARVMTGNSGWDVVFPTSYVVPPIRELGLLARLDQRRLPNLANIAPLYRRPVWDPDLNWSVPYMWNATGICADKSKGVVSWANLWNRDLRGHLTMLDDPVDVFAAALKRLGRSVNSSSTDDLQRAAALALEQKQLLQAYINAEVRDHLVAGDVSAAQLWSTTAQQAIDATERLTFVFPEEGFPLYMDTAVVLRESSRPELAHAFVDYLLRPQVAADVVLAVRTATANGAAQERLPAGLRGNTVLYPTDQVLRRGEWVLASSPEVQRLRDRLWTELKSG